ncbi:MAG: hypothetical protein HY054_09825 [Proteobacteria bacterium]|nr:hypothetical protein [Pseudomonadota bacterium]
MNPQTDLPLAPSRKAPTKATGHGDRRAAAHIRRHSGDLDAPHMLTIADMPVYPDELHVIVAAMLAQLRPDRVLLTYRAIDACFGVSRATVARRVKEGLVPGVRMANGRVLDDGPVRRFDRIQLHWLLLAVRFGKRRD